MHKFKKIALLVGIAIYLVFSSGFVSKRKSEVLCNKLNIVIADSASKRFVEKSDILGILNSNAKLPLGDPVATVNTDEIEKLVQANSLVKECEAYSMADGTLYVNLRQREPVVRIIDNKDRSYFLDSE